MTNEKYGTLYIGVTSDLVKRTWQHKNKIFRGFTSRYNLDKLVYYEVFIDEENAILREKRMKRFKRMQKIELIEKMNPTWEDLYKSII